MDKEIKGPGQVHYAPFQALESVQNYKIDFAGADCHSGAASILLRYFQTQAPRSYRFLSSLLRVYTELSDRD